MIIASDSMADPKEYKASFLEEGTLYVGINSGVCVFRS